MLTTFVKSSIIDVWLGSKQVFVNYAGYSQNKLHLLDIDNWDMSWQYACVTLCLKQVWPSTDLYFAYVIFWNRCYSFHVL